MPRQMADMTRSSLVFVVVGLVAGCGARTDMNWADEVLGAYDDAATVVTDTGGILPGEDTGAVVDTATIVPGDTAPPPPSTPIACGSDACDSAKEECCLPAMPGGGEPVCTPRGTCKGGALACSSSASCAAGQQCCLDRGGFGTPPSSTCKTACEGGREGEIMLCTRDSECPSGTRCRRLGGGLSGCIRG